MNLALVEKIADAVLYEGYILYPYRPSSVKNQRRWNFGALCPRAYSEAQRGTEAWTMQTECLVDGNDQTAVAVKVRFLHLLMREIGELVPDCRLPIADCGHREIQSSLLDSHFRIVQKLEVNGRLFQAWQEAVDREVHLPGHKLAECSSQSCRTTVSFPRSETVEALRDEGNGETVGVIVRRQQAIEGVIEIEIVNLGFQPAELVGTSAESINRQSAIGNRQSPLKITVRILNLTALENADEKSRDDALLRSFVSTHTILTAHDGEFVSLLDPPEVLREVVTSCNNVGTWPVLAGEDGERDMMLSSPIILYDYPQIAPESAGDLFDATEIDEILTLRIMTLTDEEKREMRGVDERARQLLERTESLPMEQLMKMHGAIRQK